MTGTQNLGNGTAGVSVSLAMNTAIGGTAAGAGNTIAFNNNIGVLIISGSGNPILSNSIFSNAVLGISLASPGGGNHDQAAPVLTSANSTACDTAIVGTLASAANTSYLIEFFSNPAADPNQGKTLLGSTAVTTDNTGNAAINVTLPVAVAAGQFVTATATNTGVASPNINDTSQFSTSIAATGNATPGTLQFNAANFQVNENGGTVTITVTRTGGSDCPASVNFATSDGTALAGTDYTAASGTLNWADGDAADKTFTITILDNNTDNADKTVNLTLSTPTGAVLGALIQAVLTILDNEQATAGGGCALADPSNASFTVMILPFLGVVGMLIKKRKGRQPPFFKHSRKARAS